VLFDRPAGRVLGNGVVAVGAQLGVERGVLGRDDGARATGPLAGGERPGPFKASHILLDGREGDLERARGFGFRHPAFYGPHDPLT
jgi:hypothetical protein